MCQQMFGHPKTHITCVLVSRVVQQVVSFFLPFSIIAVSVPPSSFRRDFTDSRRPSPYPCSLSSLLLSWDFYFVGLIHPTVRFFTGRSVRFSPTPPGTTLTPSYFTFFARLACVFICASLKQSPLTFKCSLRQVRYPVASEILFFFLIPFLPLRLLSRIMMNVDSLRLVGLFVSDACSSPCLYAFSLSLRFFHLRLSSSSSDHTLYLSSPPFLLVSLSLC